MWIYNSAKLEHSSYQKKISYLLIVCAADIGNADLNEDCKERIWVKAGKEVGTDEGNPMIIVKALYGLKLSDTVWINLLF